MSKVPEHPGKRNEHGNMELKDWRFFLDVFSFSKGALFQAWFLFIVSNPKGQRFEDSDNDSPARYEALCQKTSLKIP